MRRKVGHGLSAMAFSLAQAFSVVALILLCALLPAVQAQTNCNAGQYCSASSRSTFFGICTGYSNTCTACPSGYFRTSSCSTTCACQNNPCSCGGLACSTASATTACTFCGANTVTSITNNVGATARSQCQCVIGFYGNPNVDGGSCTACPTGTTTGAAGATEASQCVCAAGFTGPAGGPCTICPAGTAKPVGTGPCIPCSPGTWAAEGAGSCTACAVNTYNPQPEGTSSASCLACPAGSQSPTASTAITSCVCSPGFSGPDGGPCTACAPGTVKTITGDAPCVACRFACDPNANACSTSACATTCQTGFRASPSTNPLFCYPQLTSVEQCGTVDETAPSTVSNSGVSRLGYQSSAGGGRADIFPYARFDFRTPNICITTMAFNFWAQTNSHPCGADLRHTMGLVNPNAWSTSTLNWNNRPGPWATDRIITWPNRNIVRDASNYETFPINTGAANAALAAESSMAILNETVHQFDGQLSFYFNRACTRTTTFARNTITISLFAQLNTNPPTPVWAFLSGTWRECDPVTSTCTPSGCACRSTYTGTYPYCIRRVCTAQTFADGIAFPSTNAGDSALGTCPEGTVPSGTAPTRVCSDNAVWGSLSGSCGVPQCPQVTEGNADFPATNVGTNNVAGTCVNGFAGSVFRNCVLSGNTAQWGSILGSCIAITCPVTTNDNTVWPLTEPQGASLSVTATTCAAGYEIGAVAPTRTCLADGQWANDIANPCQIKKCPAIAGNDVGVAEYPVANAFQTVGGTCITPWSGNPTRVCQPDGTWASETNPCALLGCPDIQADIGTGQGAYTQTSLSTTDAEGTCPPGWVGSTFRDCGADGVWGAEQSNCTRLVCEGTTTNFADWPSSLAGTNALGSCVPGYEGSPRRACQLDGNFSDTIESPCTRRICSETTFDNAVWPATNSDEVAQGVCIPGYAGTPTRLCSLEGVFSVNVTDSCIQLVCNGTEEDNAAWPDALSGDSVNGLCNPGYTGAPTRLCGLTGEFAAIENPCTRLLCLNEKFAFSSWTTTGSGDVVNGTCEPGYSGLPSRECNITGEWSSEIINPCERLSCPALANEDNAEWPTALSGEAEDGTCVDGYEGSPSRLCELTGEWGTIQNSCTRKRCPQTSFLEALWPESFAGDPPAVGGCTPGWIPSNNASETTRACLLSGEWAEDVANACIQLTCPAEDGTGNANWPLTLSGESATTVCLEGFEGAPFRECGLDGNWEPVQSPCTVPSCPAITTGTASFPATPVQGNAFEVSGTCQAGYTGEPKRNCNPGGTWGPVTDTCTPLFCSDSDPDAQLDGASFPTVAAGSVAVGTCDPASSKPFGAPQRLCQLDGSWSSDILANACTDAPCPALLDDNNADWGSGTLGEVSTGVCVAGWTKSGLAPSRACQGDGQWSTTISDPCQQNTCGAETLGGALFEVTPAGATGITGICEQPNFVGGPTRNCLLDGNWQTIDDSACRSRQCLSRTESRALWPASDVDTRVVGECVPGWTGEPVRQCQINGIWASIEEFCVQLRCSDDGSGFANWPVSVAAGTDSVPGVCQVGYEGSPTRSCLINGTYSAVSNPCTRRICPSITTGRATWNDTLAGTTEVVGVCEDGFSSGAMPPKRDCQLLGTWGPPTASCAQLFCPETALGESDGFATWSSTAAGRTNVAAVSCQTGYGGTPSRTCSITGEWSNVSNPCTRLVCPSTTASFATWSAAEAGTVDVPGICLAGYGDGGEPPVRTCLNSGSWGAVVGACTVLRCPASQLGGEDGFAVWSRGTANTTAVGSCQEGYEGSPTRFCSITGQWEEVTNPCTRRSCGALDETPENASWPASLADGTQVEGTCLPGYQGSAFRTCQTNANWGPASSTCQRIFCAEALDDVTATWVRTPSGQVAVLGTCRTGYQPTSGTPARDCYVNGTWGPVSNSCQQLQCAGTREIELHMSFPSALAGTLQVEGTCDEGFTLNQTRNPFRDCQLNGSFGSVTGSCVPQLCPALTSDLNANWPNNVAAGSIGSGTCVPGYQGSPQRQCLISGNWAAALISGNCQQVFCPSDSSGFANWPTTATSANIVIVSGVCLPTYSGSPTRRCNPDGTWEAVSNPCTEITCPLNTVNNSIWTETRAGEEIQGTCSEQFEGSPVRSCSNTGAWGPVRNPCVLIISDCPQEFNYKNAIWLPTTPGDTAVGICRAGFTSEGPPTRECLRFDQNGSAIWSSNVVNPCFFIEGSSGGNITSARQTAATAGSITVEWNSTDSFFCIQISIDGGESFFPVGTVNGTYTYTAEALREFTFYYFQITSGNEITGECDLSSFLFEAQTTISPPSQVRAGLLSTTSVTLEWQAASAFAAGYVISGRLGLGQNQRELTSTFSVIGNTTDSSFVVTDLIPATEYTFRVQSYMSDGTIEPNGILFNVRTNAPESSLEDVLRSNAGIVGGIVGAIAALFVVLLAGFAVYRRQTMKRQKQLLDDYTSQLQMLTMGRDGGLPATFFGNLDDMDAAALKMNLTVPRTQIMSEMQAQDVTNIQLPSFLLLDYTTDIRPDGRLSSTGSSGSIVRGYLLQADAIERNGGEVVAVKEVVEWPTLSTEDDMAHFHQELGIMWALSFHPNIAKLVGYTESPRTIITKLYPTDMFRYLHMQDDKEQLESHLLLHLTSGIAAGVAAIHTLKIAHRDLNAPNILLSEPKAGNVFPDPVIADFGIARALEDNRQFNSVNGYSPRYAAPEVIVRVQIKGTSQTLEDDQLSDMYSLGVILWEVLARRIPWDGYSNEDIEMNVRNGGRVPELEVDGQDKIVELVNDVIVSLIQTSAALRPSAAAVNRKFAKFIRLLLEEADDA